MPTRIELRLSENTGHRIRNFFCQVNNVVSEHIHGAVWECRLAIDLTSTHSSTKWSLSFSKMAALTASQAGDRLILVTRGKDIAAIPIVKEQDLTMAASVIHLWLVMQQAEQGMNGNGPRPGFEKLRDLLRDLLPPQLQESLLI